MPLTLIIIGIILFFTVTYIIGMRYKKPLPSKDPNDFTKTPSSSYWEYTLKSCKKCKSASSHNEYMTQICSNCGSINTIKNEQRSYRKIWNGIKWVYQYKYDDNKIEIRDKPYLGDA
jgi:hypothetical protein